MRLWQANAVSLLTLVSAHSAGTAAEELLRAIPLQDLKSGSAFLAPATVAQQNDLALNPGMLWVEQGEKLWSAAPPRGDKSCAACHGKPETMKGVSVRFPRVEERSGKLVNLELKINECRSERQKAQPFAYESAELLSLTALIAHQSRGLPMSLAIDERTRPVLKAGEALYNSRQGQLNLACALCHNDNWGRRLHSETVSQGHPTGYPVYRLEWQSMGSLHRRLRSCFFGVRAEMFPPGSNEHLALELYLTWRAQGLTVETPAIRR
ncbi:MAG: sulfur oxidation c-type cytochrome SoxA [Hyphomicrobiaceae bacterium]|nr:MAG: sulfur oxidation c-type cytochrome SoxA [Hyphomicrobiaceae bacterium]